MNRRETTIFEKEWSIEYCKENKFTHKGNVINQFKFVSVEGIITFYEWLGKQEVLNWYNHSTTAFRERF